MAFVITLPCIKTKDNACVAECPVDAIHPTKDEADFDQVDQLFIHPIDCICCSMCVDACPVRAIFPEEDIPDNFVSFIKKNADYYSGKKP
jgi:ferredoxin